MTACAHCERDYTYVRTNSWGWKQCPHCSGVVRPVLEKDNDDG